MFVILGPDGALLTEVKGKPVALPNREEADARETIEPYDPVRHPPSEPRGHPG